MVWLVCPVCMQKSVGLVLAACLTTESLNCPSCSWMTRTAQVTWASRPTWWLSASKAAAPAGWRLWLGTLLHSDLSSGRTVNVTGEHRGIPPLWVSESRASVTVYSSYLHKQHQQQCRERGRSPIQPGRCRILLPLHWARAPPSPSAMGAWRAAVC